MRLALLLGVMTALALAQEKGRVMESVKCQADPSQSYALYLPLRYAPEHSWPVIFAFDPRARGRIPVEIYQAAAEKYGYIVAASNNSQNGSWAVSMAAADAMINDVLRNFQVDEKRIYTAGMSGGARVAMGIALNSNRMAGVIASSAGYPDAKPRKCLSFILFGTAGTEDFNYLEMRQMDRALTTPHHVSVFEGGHVWLSSSLAVEAVEFLELQAMKSGSKPVDQALVENLFLRRTAGCEQKSGKELLSALEAIAADFDGLKDTGDLSSRAASLRRDKRVRDALKKDRAEEESEQRQTDEILGMERQLISSEEKQTVLSQLRVRWKHIAAAANAPEDSPERRTARRILRGLTMGAGERVKDADYRALLAEFRVRQGAK
ncbi:MAG: hypothetical protein ABJF23_09835 [Bryobacteraceae bacterium]